MAESIREIADREAAEAEREHPDLTAANGGETGGETGDQAGENGDAGGETFPVPQLRNEPEPEQPTAKRKRRGQPKATEEDEAMEAVGQALDLEASRHEEAVAEILGDDMGDLVRCPLCVTPGFVLVTPPDDFDPMQRAAVLMAMGELAPEVLKHHPDLYRCAKCDGWGDLDSGSRREATKRQQCPDCMGKGFRSRSEDQALAGVQAPPPGLAAVPPLPPVPTAMPAPEAGLVTQGGHTFRVVPGGSTDPSGRLAGHPLWGYDASLGGM